MGDERRTRDEMSAGAGGSSAGLFRADAFGTSLTEVTWLGSARPALDLSWSCVM